MTNLAIRIFSVLLFAVPAAPAASEWQFDGVGRVVAISDVHGAYDAMLRTLQNADVIDDRGQWSGGETHLVITGDLLDRGADSRKVMDLVMRLEGEAAAAGGRVHQLLGNHEVMNLVGDLRYVAPGEFAAFADDETPDERDASLAAYPAMRLLAESAEEREGRLQAFRDENPELGADADIGALADEAIGAELREEWHRLHPPGFFAHRRAFRPDGYYGRWLLTKPLLVVINRTAYVHGGLSPLTAELGLHGINGGLMDEVREYVQHMVLLNDAGLLLPSENFYRHPSALEALAADPAQPQDILDTIAAVVALNDSKIHKQVGPLWYRGNVACSRLIESDRLGDALTAIAADRVVIGHTPTTTRQVLQRLDGRVIEIDTGMLNAAYGGRGNALVVEGESIRVVNEESTESLSPVEHPRRVGARPDDLSVTDLEQMLAHGEIVSSSTDESGRTTVGVAARGHELTALFVANPRSRGVVPSLAAYRLDRLLELDMVPATVAREVDGDDGVLQFIPQRTMNESQRIESRRGSSAWCPLPDQWQAMYVFDALIFNPGRTPQNMVYSPDNWQILLVGNGATFQNRRGRPPYLKNEVLALNPAWIGALNSLDDDVLEQHFSDVLDRRRISALGKRRDEMLETATESVD